jgi:hypothetical protein
MKKLILILTVATTVGFYSCKKETMNPTNLAINSSSPKNRSQVVSVNPYEYIGKLHNNVLDNISKLSSFPNESFQADYNATISLVSKEGSKDKMPNIERIQSSMNGVDGLTFAQVIDKYYNNGLINFKQKTLLQVIDVHVQTSGEDADLLQQRLTSFENSLINRNDLTDEMKTPLFGVTTVLKNSSLYWTNAKNDTSNPWNTVGTGGERRPKWLADAIGWCNGFLDGQGLEERLQFGVIYAGLYSAAAGKK